VSALFLVLRHLENRPLPLWDGGGVAKVGLRSAAVGGLLCTAGAATLASAGWGLKDQGIQCVVVMVLALIAARGLAGADQRRLDALAPELSPTLRGTG